jgi:hypothetical protein
MRPVSDDPARVQKCAKLPSNVWWPGDGCRWGDEAERALSLSLSLSLSWSTMAVEEETSESLSDGRSTEGAGDACSSGRAAASSGGAGEATVDRGARSLESERGLGGVVAEQRVVGLTVWCQLVARPEILGHPRFRHCSSGSWLLCPSVLAM